jgi:hypothetical protein
MPSSERIIGFSTGAIAKGDFRQALTLLRNALVGAVELSALREHELPELMASLLQLDLSRFSYVSVHAPTKFNELREEDVVQLLKAAVDLRLSIIVHPDTIQSPKLWRSIGRLLLIENMDKRKHMGRTVSELRVVFEALPEAGLCFDVAHARQVDPSMIESAQMLREFHDRLREVHASGVTTRSFHGPISTAARLAFGSIAHLIPETVPIILESPIDKSMIQEEIKFARSTFFPFERLCTDIDDVFDLKSPPLRRVQAENFLSILQMTNSCLSDFEDVINHLPTGEAFRLGGVFVGASDLLATLSEDKRYELKRHLLDRVRKLARDCPDLKSKFREQFSSVD